MRLLPAVPGLLCVLLLTFPARAEETAPAAVAAAADRLGYAFEYPRVLVQQRLFGIAHGISLLAAACLDVPAPTDDVQGAYAAWRARELPAIATASADLSTYYLGAGVAATESALAKLMQLQDTLAYAPDSDQLKAACATLPQALAQPRYQLTERFRLEEQMARVVAAFEIDARDGHCRTQFPENVRQVHEARYEVWREINEPLLQQANATLVREWPVDAPTATFADWLAELRRATKVRGSLTDCLDFSASLKQPESALRNVFRMPPARRNTR